MGSIPFHSIGSTHEINSRITHHQQGLSTSSRSDDPRPLLVVQLAMTQVERHKLLKQRNDLDSAPVSWLQNGPNTLTLWLRDVTDTLSPP